MKELLITLENTPRNPLYEQIYSFIKLEIQNRNIVSGEGLPSARALALQLGVSRSTVDLAYEQLVSEGYLESIPCKGYYVCDIDELFCIGAVKPLEPSRNETVKKEYRYDFAVNGIDSEGFPKNIWRKLSKTVLFDEDGQMYQTGNSAGEWGLRQAVASYLHHARGVNASPDQIIVGAGNDYLLMLLTVILGNRRTIAMESPTYKSAWDCFHSLGHTLVSVEMDEYGMMPGSLEQEGAQIAYIMPSHQFPMGTVMPLKRRLKLLAWAAKGEERYLIEDDYDSEFRYKGKPIPALQGYDQNDRVIYLGTFSKAIAPSIRISYMVLPKSLLSSYEENGRCFSATVSRVDQKIIELFLREGHFERHLNRMRAQYKAKHDLMLKLLKNMGDICSVSGEYAGVHLQIKLRGDLTEEEAVLRAGNAGIKVYPLSAYATGHVKSRQEAVLLGYAAMSEQDIKDGMAILENVWRGQK